jgi:hypothetical protein
MPTMGLSRFTKTCKPKETLFRWMLALALASASQVATAQIVVPKDAQPTCVVMKKEFNAWFAANGSGVPPDNLNFPKQTADPCTFFRWAEHMFFWVTSRSARGNRASYVFDSSPFYAVSPLDKDMRRALIAQDRLYPDQRKRASVSISQRGPEDEAVLVDNMGVMHKILQVEGGRNPIMEKDGQKIEIGGLEIMPDKMPIFHDTHGNLIENPILRDIASGQVINVRPPPGNTIVSNGHLFFLDLLGDVIAAEPGQADDHVLMARNNRLIYHMIQVNDIYAYFLTGTKNHNLNLTMFPTNNEELAPVKQYALNHGLVSFPDESASIVELKSSWIELPDKNDYSHYISITADVPKFKHLTDTHWQQIGWRQGVKLAMVGMHVAFSVNGHPELIWATFEHVYNTPNARYRYEAIQGRQPWSQQSCGNWLFSSGHAEPDEHPRDCYGIRIHACSGDQTIDASGMCIGANHSRMYMDGGDIHAYNGEAIGPSDILRISPWGNSEFRPTPNASLISIYNSIRVRLAKGDLRKNYIMVGAIWLADPSLGYGGGTDCATSSAKGSNCVANSSIETFQQPSNCLYCHRGPEDMLRGVSHVYRPLNPLFIDAPKSLIP